MDKFPVGMMRYRHPTGGDTILIRASSIDFLQRLNQSIICGYLERTRCGPHELYVHIVRVQDAREVWDFLSRAINPGDINFIVCGLFSDWRERLAGLIDKSSDSMV